MASSSLVGRQCARRLLVGVARGHRAATLRRSYGSVAAAIALTTAGLLSVLAPAAEARVRDADRDGLSNRYERKRSHTNPRRADTDRDALRDPVELRRSKTNPRLRDTDGDLLTDGYEWRKSRTSPLRADTDRDGDTDAVELFLGADPLRGNRTKRRLNPGPPVVADPPLPTPPPMPDLLPPETMVTAGPSGTVNSASASFSFASSEAGSTFECRLDSGAWVACSSPKEYSGLANGQHSFSVRAKDSAGNVDPSAASRTWTTEVPVPDTVPPNTTVTAGPSGTVNSASASFSFASSEAGSTFECRLDSGAWVACGSPRDYSGLANGQHTFRVRATDAAGNVDGSPSNRTWTVSVQSPPPPDTAPPETTISSGPTGSVASQAASFSFTSSESGSTFQCRLDGAAWGACSSPKSYSGLGNGSHSFQVRATDAAGNTDGSPAVRTWTIDAAPSPGNNCMADPSACSFPDVENTGVTPGTTLTPVSGTVTLSTPGQVYENKLVTGMIRVTAPNVTIRNVKLVATDDSYGIQAFGWNTAVDNLVVENVEIDLNGRNEIKGIAFDSYTLRRAFIHDGSDCAHFGNDVTIEDTLCVVGPDGNNDGWPDSTSFCSIGEPDPPHWDGFQSDGGGDITLRHNTIRNPCSQTSSILLSSNTSHISRVTVDNNLMTGGGYSLYCAGMNVASSVDHIRATNNRFARTWHPRSGHWGPTAYCQFADVFTGNVWDDTGGPL
jgi:hypothetical protein